MQITLDTYGAKRDNANASVDLEEFYPSKEWDIFSAVYHTEYSYHPSSVTYTSFIIYTFKLGRSPAATRHYVMCYIMPAVLISLLVPALFMVPPGGKVPLGRCACMI